MRPAPGRSAIPHKPRPLSWRQVMSAFETTAASDGLICDFHAALAGIGRRPDSSAAQDRVAPLVWKWPRTRRLH
jgi:hypothetical protein